MALPLASYRRMCFVHPLSSSLWRIIMRPAPSATIWKTYKPGAAYADVARERDLVAMVERRHVVGACPNAVRRDGLLRSSIALSQYRPPAQPVPQAQRSNHERELLASFPPTSDHTRVS
ncbi:hypothetical protein PPTG_23731 [Phytophthora nicotianae INRA-310]|uniref:Uncharacterized protein n=1 Tax=Phytophthora nicotianae (strain INRA-310) TaxID=761204 RepID=W2PTW8_PHYN3|nr:hypothetical protein PPTG_23731 [Phytophthora nicotianae INRA-310]ETN03674.1 hypothetical protein PPTG_23731 [Phytophthora nicotianae INRA-310]